MFEQTMKTKTEDSKNMGRKDEKTEGQIKDKTLTLKNRGNLEWDRKESEILSWENKFENDSMSGIQMSVRRLDRVVFSAEYNWIKHKETSYLEFSNWNHKMYYIYYIYFQHIFMERSKST